MKYILIALLSTSLSSSVFSMEKTQNSVLDQEVITAAGNCDIEKLRKLIFEQKANVNARDPEHRATALHWVIGSRWANEDRKVLAIRFLLTETSIDPNALNKALTSPLQFAFFNQLVRVAEEIIKDSRINIDRDAETAILYAGKDQQLRNLLLQRGAVHKKDSRVEECMTNGLKPYKTLCMLFYTKGADEASKYARELAASKEDWVPHATYLLALSQSHVSILKILIEAGVIFDQPYIRESRGYADQPEAEAPRFLAKEFYKNQEIIDLLSAYGEFRDAVVNNTVTPELVHDFTKRGFSLNCVSMGFQNGMVAYHIENGNSNFVRTLVEAGASAEGIKVSHLAHAAGCQANEIMEYLLDRGVDIKRALESTKNEADHTFLISVLSKKFSKSSK